MYKEKDMSVAETMSVYGCDNITTVSLLAAIIGSKEKAKRLFSNIASYADSRKDFFVNLRKKNFKDIMYAGNLTEKEAARMMAALELGKRFSDESEEEVHIGSPWDATSFLKKYLAYENHERFLVVLVNTKNIITRVVQISEGSLTSSTVHPREVFAPAVTEHAAAVLVAHNHPSGNPLPSHDDDTLTEALCKAGDTLGIPVLDHVIIAKNNDYSYKLHGRYIQS